MARKESTKPFVHKPAPKGDAIPPCSLYGICGGCTNQHEKHETQLFRKKNEILTLFRKGEIPETYTYEVISGEAYHYRNRMDFAFSKTLKGEYVGLREKNSFQYVVNLEECHLALPRINEILTEVQELRRVTKSYLDLFDIYIQEGTLKYATIRVTANAHDESLTFILNQDSEKKDEVVDLIEQFAEESKIKNILIGWVERKRDQSISENIEVIKGDRLLTENLVGKSITFDNQSFFQNHTAMIEKIILKLRDWMLEKKDNHFLLDLYGGAGTFGVTLGDLFKDLSVVDMQGPNIEQALENLTTAGLSHAKVLTSDALNFDKVITGDQAESTYVVDPPRAGLHPKVLDKILKLGPKTIYYVSCNPKQFVLELKTLQQRYVLKKTALFDLFPQTPHLELVSQLDRID